MNTQRRLTDPFRLHPKQEQEFAQRNKAAAAKALADAVSAQRKKYIKGRK